MLAAALLRMGNCCALPELDSKKELPLEQRYTRCRIIQEQPPPRVHTSEGHLRSDSRALCSRDTRNGSGFDANRNARRQDIFDNERFVREYRLPAGQSPIRHGDKDAMNINVKPSIGRPKTSSDRSENEEKSVLLENVKNSRIGSRRSGEYFALSQDEDIDHDNRNDKTHFGGVTLNLKNQKNVEHSTTSAKNDSRDLSSGTKQPLDADRNKNLSETRHEGMKLDLFKHDEFLRRTCEACVPNALQPLKMHHLATRSGQHPTDELWVRRAESESQTSGTVSAPSMKGMEKPTIPRNIKKSARSSTLPRGSSSNQRSVKKQGGNYACPFNSKKTAENVHTKSISTLLDSKRSTAEFGLSKDISESRTLKSYKAPPPPPVASTSKADTTPAQSDVLELSLSEVTKDSVCKEITDEVQSLDTSAECSAAAHSTPLLSRATHVHQAPSADEPPRRWNAEPSNFSSSADDALNKDEVAVRDTTPCNAFSQSLQGKSYLLSEELQIPDCVAHKKNLKELIEAFKNSTSVMRKPCKEFLDGTLYQEAKEQHHNTLLATVRAMSGRSLPCVADQRCRSEGHRQQYAASLARMAGGMSVRKELDFNVTLPRKKRKRSSARAAGACATRSANSTLKKAASGNAAATVKDSFELLDLDDFLTIGDSSCANSTLQASNFEALGEPLLFDVNTSNKSTSSAKNLQFEFDVFKGTIFSSPKKKSPTETCESDAWWNDYLKVMTQASESQTAQKDKASCDEIDSSAVLMKLELDESLSEQQKSPKNSTKTELFKDAQNGVDVGVDKSAEKVATVTSTPQKETSNRRSSCASFDNDDVFSGGSKNVSSADTRLEAADSPPYSGRGYSLLKSTSLSQKSFEDFECSDAGPSNDRFNTSDFFALKSRPWRALEDSGSCTQTSQEIDKFKEFKKSFVNDLTDSNLKIGDVSDNGVPIGTSFMDSSNERNRLNNSPSNDFDLSDDVFSVSQSTKFSTTFLGGHFASLSGRSPVFQKKSFKFDDDPRFDSKRASFKDDADEDALDFGFTSAGVQYREDKLRKPRSRSDNFDSWHDEDNTSFLRADENVGSDSLFNASKNFEEIEKDTCLAAKYKDCSKDKVVGSSGEEEGLSVQLGRHVKVSAKGLSVGALGCELTVGQNVQLNLFGKTATLV